MAANLSNQMEGFSLRNEEEDEGGEWEEWEDEEADEGARSLFDEAVLPSVAAAFQHDADKYGFDLRQYRLLVTLSLTVVCNCTALPLFYASTRELCPEVKLMYPSLESSGNVS
jgi:hypothetical protein